MARAKKKAASDEHDLAMMAKIRADIAQWKPGLWAEIVAYGPACICGISEDYIEGNRGYTKHGIPTGKCERHS